MEQRLHATAEQDFILEGSEYDITSSSTFMPSRSDGKGYIDESQPTEGLPNDQASETAHLSGSSLEEELEDAEEDDGDLDQGTTSYANQDSGAVQYELDDRSNKDPELFTGDWGDDSVNDWEVEDEDWELAQGDFTKQYNRLRQQHAATRSSSSGSGLTPASTASRPPLPARNAHPREGPKSGRESSSMASKHHINSAVFTGGVNANPKSSLDRQDKDKSDRATQEQVLDNRTRLVISGLAKRCVIGSIRYCISTGKEANVYHAEASPTPPLEPSPFPASLAVKIYRTSILNFRSRQNYIVGEHRFRGDYTSAKNPRKMVRVWAEKELRNLRRLEQDGIRAPRVIGGKENILVMEFLGHGEHPSPRLKDADIPIIKLSDLYLELLVTMRRMYHHCKLVHADLSEYNILYHDSHLYIIDVSQSVGHDHPRTFEFLRNDLRNVNDFFARRSVGEVRIMGMRRTWDFVVNDFVDGLPREAELGQNGEKRLMSIARAWIRADDDDADDEHASETTGKAVSHESAKSAASDEAVFMSSFIPRNLTEVYDPERDVDILNSGRGEQLIYAGLTGINTPVPEVRTDTASTGIVESQEEDGLPQKLRKAVRFEDAKEDVGSVDGVQVECIPKDSRLRGFRHEEKQAKKDRKQAVKEERREKRRAKAIKADKQK